MEILHVELSLPTLKVCSKQCGSFKSMENFQKFKHNDDIIT